MPETNCETGQETRGGQRGEINTDVLYSQPRLCADIRTQSVAQTAQSQTSRTAVYYYAEVFGFPLIVLECHLNTPGTQRELE